MHEQHRRDAFPSRDWQGILSSHLLQPATVTACSRRYPREDKKRAEWTGGQKMRSSSVRACPPREVCRAPWWKRVADGREEAQALPLMTKAKAGKKGNRTPASADADGLDE